MTKTPEVAVVECSIHNSSCVTTKPFKTNFQKVQEFHKVFGKEPDPETPTVPSKELAELRANLILEETIEALTELNCDFHSEKIQLSDGPIDLAKVAKELSDILYVVYGTAASLGIPIDRVFAEVHTSNMSKLTKDGEVLRREDGKVLKGPLYREPDLSFLVPENKSE